MVSPGSRKSVRRHLQVILGLMLVLVVSTACRKQDETRPGGGIFPAAQIEENTVVPANNRGYFPMALSLIREARHTIDCIFYQVRCYAAQPDSPSNLLLTELTEAVKRGVRVRFLIERSWWNPENTFLNRIAAELLSRHGIEVRYDDPEVNTHNKLIIIDDQVVITGSANWSYYSLARNNESNVAVWSGEISKQMTDYFNSLYVEASPQNEDLYTTVGLKELSRRQERDGTVRVNCRLKGVSVGAGGPLMLNLEEQVDCRVPSVLEAELGALFAPDLHELLDRDLSLLIQIVRSGDAAEYVLAGIDTPSLSQRIDSLGTFPAPPGHVREPARSIWQRGYVAESIHLLLNGDYFFEVEHEINQSSDLVRVIQIQSDYFPARSNQPEHPRTNRLAWALMNRLKAGVPVEFLTEYRSGEPLSREKRAFLNRIHKSGGKVLLDDGAVTTHCKLLILDHHKMIIGSTNWSLPALESNNESSLLIKCPQLADYFDLYFQRLCRAPYK